MHERKASRFLLMAEIIARVWTPAGGVIERLLVRICVVLIGVKLTAWVALLAYGLWHLMDPIRDWRPIYIGRVRSSICGARSASHGRRAKHAGWTMPI